MKQNKKVSGVLICMLAVALVLSIYYAAVYTGLSQKVSALELQHSQNVQQLSTYHSMILKKAQTKAEIVDLQTKVKQFSQSLGVPAPELAPDIQRGLTAAGVSALSLTMNAPSAAAKTTSGRTLMKVQISLVTDCTQDELTALLHYFEKDTKAEYVINTVAVATDKAQGGSSSGKETVALTMTANYLTKAGSAS